MKLDDILNEWAEDCNMDRTELGEEALKIPKLHSKYLRYFSEERLLLRRMEEERKDLVMTKHDYYRGILPEEDLKANGWEPFRLSVLKSEVHTYIDADQDIIKSNLKLAMQQEKVDTLESIIKSISNRGYLIKSAIDYEKFKVGA
jgi:Recombination, repair and ssDNA binding protein UvsY